MHEALRCRVHGRVQGVSFRAATCARGAQLGLAGYARNLPDGSVEVYARGELGALQRLRRWLAEGPEQARVERLECETAGLEPVEGFNVRY